VPRCQRVVLITVGGEPGGYLWGSESGAVSLARSVKLLSVFGSTEVQKESWVAQWNRRGARWGAWVACRVRWLLILKIQVVSFFWKALLLIRITQKADGRPPVGLTETRPIIQVVSRQVVFSDLLGRAAWLLILAFYCTKVWLLVVRHLRPRAAGVVSRLGCV
jgi:hypothetical protein